MKTLMVISTVLFASLTFAKPNVYEISMDLSIDGKHISSPRVVTSLGETAEIIQKSDDGSSTSLKVLATEGQMQDRKGIHLKLEVASQLNNGKTSIIAKPEFLVQEDKPTTATIGKGDNTVEVSVTVKKVVL